MVVRTLLRKGGSRLLVPVLAAVLAGGIAVSAPPAGAAIGPDGAGGIVFDAGYLRLGLSSIGQVTSLVDTRTAKNHIVTGHGTAPLVSLVVNGQQVTPSAVTLANNTLSFTNSSAGVTIDVAVQDKTTYTTLAVTNVSAPTGADVQTLLWGPVPTSITHTLGEAAGIVRDSSFAIGMKVLTDRTEGGWPRVYRGTATGWQNEVQSSPYGATIGSMEQWSVGARTAWGTLLRAYTVDYTKQRDGIAVLNGNQSYPIKVGPLPSGQGTVVGSKIALFGTTPDMALTVLSNIASQQGLPYPTLNGQWQKVSQDASKSFFLPNGFSPSSLNSAINYAKSAGLDTVYSVSNSGPWASHGHNQFAAYFGGSDSAVKSMVDQAAAASMEIGTHQLSDFIDSNDPWITPTPSPDLVRGPSATLAQSLAATDTTAVLTSCDPMNTSIRGKRLLIDNEYVVYTGYTQSGTQCTVTGLTRAQWYSTAAAHNAGAGATRIPENQYGGGYGNLNIINTIATRFATILNTVGVKSMSFDGLESASEAGWGSYGMATIVNNTRRQLTSPEGVIFETSRLGSNVWDGLTRASWGETYQTMAQAMTNHEFLRANYMPGGLGVRLVYGDTTVLSIEDALARCAGLNTGYDFRVTMSNLGAGPNTAQVLDAIKQWETARNLGAFTAAQRVLLQDESTHWHLSVVTAGSAWSLQQIDTAGNPIGAAQPVVKPTPAFTTTTLPALTVGKLYEAKVATNNPQTIRYTVTSGALPAGLTLNKDTGGITGIPTSATPATFTITGTGGNGTANAVRTFTIGTTTGGALNLASKFNNVGVTSQSNTAPGDFDYSGNSYSAEQLAKVGITPGATVTTPRATFTWPTAAAGTPNNVAGGSAVVQAGGLSGNKLAFLGSETGGVTGNVTVTYTDGTTTTAATGFPNWVNGTPGQFGSTLVASTTGRNMQSGYGDTARQFQLFYNEISIDPAKSVSTVTLPADGKIHIFAATVTTVKTGPLNLAGKFNNVGVTSQSNTAPGDFDYSGNSYSAEQLATVGITPGATVTAPGATFTWPTAAAGTPNNVAGGSAVISATGLSGSKLAFLGAETGGVTGTVTVTYTDGTTSTGTTGFSNWVNGIPNQFGSTLVASTTGRNMQSGYGDTARQFQLFYNDIAIDPTKTISTVTLPADGKIHIFAATVTNSAAGPLSLAGKYNNVGITSQSNTTPGNFDGSGNSYSAEQLAAAGVNPGSTVTVGKVGFKWPSSAPGTPDNIVASGAVIHGNGLGGSRLSFLGSSTVNLTAPVAITYTDGSSTMGSIGFPQWVGDNTNKWGGTLAVNTTGRNAQTGYGDTARSYQVFAVDMPIDPTKTIASVSLPLTTKIHIFAVSVHPAGA